jgi:hypothetical protein
MAPPFHLELANGALLAANSLKNCCENSVL